MTDRPVLDPSNDEDWAQLRFLFLASIALEFQNVTQIPPHWQCVHPTYHHAIRTWITERRRVSITHLRFRIYQE